MALKALIFDVDGTLAETEEYHRRSFNQSFLEFGAEFDIDWIWDRKLYAELLNTTGGKERILFYAKSRKHHNLDVGRLHSRKTEIYLQYIIDGKIKLRPGVKELISFARQNSLKMAIATTTTKINVENLLLTTLGSSSLDWFEIICCGDDVTNKKPDAEVYLRVLDHLGLPPNDCFAIEDSQIGLKSAIDAKIPVVITPSIYTSDHNFDGAQYIVKDLTSINDYLAPFLHSL